MQRFSVGIPAAGKQVPYLVVDCVEHGDDARQAAAHGDANDAGEGHAEDDKEDVKGKEAHADPEIRGGEEG